MIYKKSKLFNLTNASICSACLEQDAPSVINTIARYVANAAAMHASHSYAQQPWLHTKPYLRD